ncbi:hypothetical protein WA158_005089 [Blastocystis sp. Blastoise]
MNMKYILLISLILSVVSAKKWAVLVAGSEGIENYRHQADNAHAYHMLINHGYDPEHIIVFSKNDVPNDKENPIPNTLYNRPGNDSINYYENYVIDYEGADNTPDNYVKVLLGDKSTGKKVLETTEDDIIFLAFYDHGQFGRISFPNDDLTADVLQSTFKQMKEKKMFKRIVYYMEACFSGSMFYLHDTIDGIYALTAAYAGESSWSYYCGDEAVVNGVKFDTCLGDEFAIRWMENVDEGNLAQTFREHAENITEQVKMSHVTRYFDFSFENDTIAEVFQGDLVYVKMNRNQKFIEGTRDDIYLNKLHYLSRKLLSFPESEYYKSEYENEKKKIELIDTYFSDLYNRLISNKIIDMNSLDKRIDDWKCYNSVVNKVRERFGRNDYLNKYVSSLGFICNQIKDLDQYL